MAIPRIPIDHPYSTIDRFGDDLQTQKPFLGSRRGPRGLKGSGVRRERPGERRSASKCLIGALKKKWGCGSFEAAAVFKWMRILGEARGSDGEPRLRL